MYLEFPIIEVAEKCGLRIGDKNLSRIEVRANCPFCDDKKKHLYLNTNKNVFFCQRCAAKGNALTLFAWFENDDYKTAYRKLATNSDLSNYNSNRAFYDNNITNITEQLTRPLADRHEVYYDFIELLKLSDTHKNNLLSRGLNITAIEENKYKTLPVRDSKEYASVMYDISHRHDLTGIPGFYRSNNNWHVYSPEGFLIPICNHQGYIQGFQIRHDGNKSKRYNWFSSSFSTTGAKVKPAFHVSNWHGSKKAIITEGGLKADVTSFLTDYNCVIGVPGVNYLEGIDVLLTEMGITELVEAFDMDKLTNPRVASAIEELDRIITRTEIKYSHATWSESFKGIDDLCLWEKKKISV